MFVLIGIVILIASFVIALISLFAEQRKNEHAQMHPDDVDAPKARSKVIQQVVDPSAAVDETTESKRDEATAHLEELVELQKARTNQDVGEVVVEKQKRAAFPWEETSGQIEGTAYTSGDQTEEMKLQDSEPLASFDDITESSIEDPRTLSGVIELRKKAKEQKKAA